jgi:hypothetical protein
MMNRLISVLIYVFLSAIGNSQEGHNPFTLRLSIGPNYYFNNLELFNENVRPVNYSTYVKFLWNTRYRLSFGIETGVVRLYRIEDVPFDKEAGSSITAIPIHLAMQMRIYSHFFLSGSFGPTILRNRTTSSKSENITGTTSIADLSLGVGYKHQLGKNTHIGAELKYFYSSKAEDRNLAIPLFFEVNF